MVNPQYAAHLREKAAALPLSPGIYIMRDAAGKVIYVGKSRALRNRVSQYFHESAVMTAKTDAMTSRVCDFDYILCDTEIEALTLENSLIKQHHPKYNIKLKDDKSYPYLKATTDEEFPRFLVTRKREGDKAKYFGPYTGVATAYGILAALQKTFGLPSCRHLFPRDRGRISHCMYRQIGCVAPCDESVPPEVYREAFREAVSFLSDGEGALISTMTEKMNYAAEHLAYEAAAAYRDRIAAVRKLSEKQKVVADPSTERDICAFYGGEPVSAVCLFYVRGGKLLDSEYFTFSGGEIMDSAALASLLCRLYEQRGQIPRELDLCDPLTEEDMTALAAWLSEHAGRKINVRVPVRGEIKNLCNMARENAQKRAQEYADSSEKSEKALVRLAALCGLETVPERIEAFDVSNIGDEFITAGMVAYENARPQKKDYRLYRIRSTETRDDYTSMREAVERRLAHLGDEGEKRPDLLLIDGGENHRAIAAAAVAAAGLAIPVFGMVKDDHHKTRALVGASGEVSIAAEKAVYALIFKIQEEVHRYTYSHMSAAKRKSQRTSVLEEINGVGAGRAKKLLTEFGGLAGVKRADISSLAAIPGIPAKTAEAVYTYFHPEKKKGNHL